MYTLDRTLNISPNATHNNDPPSANNNRTKRKTPSALTTPYRRFKTVRKPLARIANFRRAHCAIRESIPRDFQDVNAAVGMLR